MNIRIHRKERYTLVSTEAINKLSWGAIGLLAFLCSKKKGEIVTKEDILEACTNSEEEVDSFLVELDREGLL